MILRPGLRIQVVWFLSAMAVATQCGTAVAPAIRVRDFVAKCSYSGGQRCCLVDVQKRFEGVGSRRGGVRSAPLKRSMRTRAMYVDDDNEASVVLFFC